MIKFPFVHLVLQTAIIIEYFFPEIRERLRSRYRFPNSENGNAIARRLLLSIVPKSD